MNGDSSAQPFPLVAALLAAVLLVAATAGSSASGNIPYDKFEGNDFCAECHHDIARQYDQAMMSRAYTHSWDEIEYFELALPHARKEKKVAGIEAGCNGCHAPLAFLAGDIPPQRPSAGTRANESVSCDLCHSITGFEGDVPFNFNYKLKPGDVVQGTRSGLESMGHEIEVSPFLGTAEFCGICHNEKDPWGQWVKATHLEWKEGPYGKAGIVCQNCHMPKAAGKSAADGGKEHPDVRQHLFHGAHDPGKLAGSVEVRIHPDRKKAVPGEKIRLTATVINAKAGHMIPTGSAEERVLWLHVEAADASGRRHHLVVDPKGFPGEEYTIANPEVLAYQDIGYIQGKKDFPGLPRDGSVPAGDRIYRLPYLDPHGHMTIAQWHTAGFGPDYRLPPLSARNETFTWSIPPDLEPGPVTVRAEVWYSRLVDSVGRYLGVPAEEYEPVLVNVQETSFEVVQS